MPLGIQFPMFQPVNCWEVIRFKLPLFGNAFALNKVADVSGKTASWENLTIGTEVYLIQPKGRKTG